MKHAESGITPDPGALAEECNNWPLPIPSSAVTAIATDVGGHNRWANPYPEIRLCLPRARRSPTDTGSKTIDLYRINTAMIGSKT